MKNYLAVFLYETTPKDLLTFLTVVAMLWAMWVLWRVFWYDLPEIIKKRFNKKGSEK